MSGVWRLLPCLGLMYVVWRHGGGAERFWSEKRSVLHCPMQRTALPLAARCNYGCSALHLKSGCSADSWGMGPASFSQRFPLLLSSFSVSSLISFHLFSHPFPLLLSSFSVSSLISFHLFSHPFLLLLSFLSFSSPIAFRPSLSCASVFIVLYGKALPAMVPCRALLYCSSRQRTCALWDGLVSCVGRGAQYWNV